MNRETFDKVNDYIKRNGGSAAAACKALNLSASNFYLQKSKLTKTKLKKKLPKMFQVHAAPPAESPRRLAVVIGEPHEVESLLKGLWQ